jgi:HK97 family phage major capsid protein
VLLLPEQDMGPIEKLLLQYTPMRRYAQVVQINAYTYKKPMRKDPGGARWGDELSSGGATTTPSFYNLDIPAHNLYAEPATSQDVLEDVTYDLEGELSQGSLDAFAIAESGAFVAGSGVEKPKGFLAYTNVSFANGTPDYDKIGYMPTGTSGAFDSTAPGDALVMLPYKLLAGYRQNGKYMANRNTIASMRTFKDSTGAYLWTAGNLTLGQPNTFNGYEAIEAEDMPDIAANSYSIAFSDFERSYLIVDRTGLSVLRDPYTQSPAIVFKTRKRVGGAVKNCRAIGLVKFAAS